ncbi:nucleotidyltransferase domain protein [bacterium BMS3Bbin04]|nr:nucleotidyltransferase domain protein [bacterium BMS3Bbin04]
MDDKLAANLDSAVELWKQFWGDELESIHLYGSLARGDWSKGSDINLVMFVKNNDYSRWSEAAGIIRRKMKKGFGIPLMMTRRYLESSLDVYPIEFLDMKLFHKTLYGDDPFESLNVELRHLRLQAEREIKGKWVAMRQAALELSGNTSGTRDLLARSVPTWNAVFQALLVIDGQEVPADKQQVMQAGCKLVGLDASVFEELLMVRNESKNINRNAASSLLTRALEQVDKLAIYADKLSVNE